MVDRFATINNACVSERHSLYTYRASLHGVIIWMNHYTIQELRKLRSVFNSQNRFNLGKLLCKFLLNFENYTLGNLLLYEAYLRRKENSDIFVPVLQSLFNANISQNDFKETLKVEEISSLYKKDDNFVKKHYRPITILPATSKMYERLMESQMNAFAPCFLNSLVCGFRDIYSTRHARLGS